jgi:acetyl-CoA carboxylase carboxyl transferase subunit beta
VTEPRLGARELIDVVLDVGSWVSWDSPVVQPDGISGQYAVDLARAQRRSGVDESLITGSGAILGRRVAIIACDFGFLAGSIGLAAAERLVRAVERATLERLPLVAAPCSGGTRMQEGTLAFVAMVKISAAIATHRRAGLPYLVYLRHPTTGGVFASWGSLGHLTAAEPGALIGFLGPRVYEALYDEPFPPGVQVSGNLLECGLLDAVVDPDDLRSIAANALDVLAPAADMPGEPAPLPIEELPDVPAWESIERSRREQRPGVRALLRAAAHAVTPMRGTGEGEVEPGLLLALARFGAAPCVVLGQDRRVQQRQGTLGPAGLREARRGMSLAAELNLPLVTIIDTAGAALSKEAEEGGLAGEIARCLAELVMLSAPTICVLLGQGCGGGALALLPADRVLCAQHAWLSPLPPEGASVILYRDVDHASDLAREQGVRSLDLLRNGIVDRIVAERPDAADEPTEFLGRLGQLLEYELIGLARRDDAERLATRLEKYRNLGSSR